MRNRISVQIAFAVIILALLGAIAVSFLSYFTTYSSEVALSQHTLLELGQTVQSTASIAAFMNDSELAKEVIQGLKRNELVATVELTGSTGLSMHSGATKLDSPEPAVRLKLDSPFTPGETVGELLITLNQKLIDARARQSAWKNAALLGGYTLFIALLVLLLIQWRFISGIKQIASNLGNIMPGHKERLPYPARHHHDEVGGLVNDINGLLNLAQENLEAEQALLGQVENLERHFRMIFERAGVGIFLMDQRARVVLANPAFQEIIGDEAYQRIQGKDVNCIFNLFCESDKTINLIEEAFEHGRLSNCDLLMSESRGKPRWVHCLLTPVKGDKGAIQRSPVFIQGIITDISERKEEEHRMRLQAEHDPLTHLLNRRAAEHAMSLMLEKARYDDVSVAICLVDLDNFKPINDTYGHDAGDKVLIETSKRMKQALHSGDLVARLGGDEFLLAIQGPNSKTDIALLLDKLLDALSKEIEIGNDIRVQIGASIGVALLPDHGTELNQLMTVADRAMYQVKQQGKKGYRFHDPSQS